MHRPRHLARRLQQRNLDSTNNLYLNTECGLNRVAVRSALIRTTDPAPAPIVVTASRDGLKPATVRIVPVRVAESNGIANYMPQHLPVTKV